MIEAKAFVDQFDGSYSTVTVQDYCSRISVSSFNRWRDCAKRDAWGSFKGGVKKRRRSLYGEVEEELNEYVDYRSERMAVDHVGIS